MHEGIVAWPAVRERTGIPPTHRTWYRSYGGATPSHEKLPLLIAHGGPGMSHDYLLPLAQLANDGRQVVFYDQLGNGNSSRYPGTAGDTDFWTPELFLTELRTLITHLGFGNTRMHFLGQSWGGMLGIEYAVSQPSELASLILSDSPSSMITWASELGKLRAGLPRDVRQVLDAHELADTTEGPEYAEATLEFYRRHLCRLDPWPDEMQRSYDLAIEDPTVYGTMIGPNEFHVTGSLATWNMDDALGRISVPTLVVNGEFDEATDEVVRACRERIPRAEYAHIVGASHTPHLEQPELTIKIFAEFLNRHDPS